MKQRILSGILMLPLLILVYFGGIALTAGCFIVGMIGVREFFGGFRKIGIEPSNLIAYLCAAGLYAIHILNAAAIWHMFWFFGTVLACLLYMFNINNRKISDGAATLTGVLYVIFFSFHVTLIDQAPGFRLMVWLVFLTAFGTDIMAYFTGLAIGKHKLCPGISPKKTIEGAVGGIFGSIMFCGIFGYFFMSDFFIHCLIVGALGGVFSQFGDLTASVFKRYMGIKDYGNLIPGHGGVLDRFDSVLFTAPMVYYYIALILN